MSEPDDIESLLKQATADDPLVAQQLSDHVYHELRMMAERHLQQHFGRRAAHITWQPTVLAHETVIRLIKYRYRYDGSGHFFAIANTAMRSVLLDYARRRTCRKRGGDRVKVSFNPDVHGPWVDAETDVDRVEQTLAAIETLSKLDRRKGEIASLRLLWDLSIQEIAESLGVSRATVERDWSFSRAWLQQTLSRETGRR